MANGGDYEENCLLQQKKILSNIKMLCYNFFIEINI